MIKISNSALLNTITKLLFLLVVAKGASLALWWYLPSDGEELSTHANYQPRYQRVDFKNMIEKDEVKKETKTKEVVAVSSGINITNMTLKGLYGNETKGYAILSLKSKPKETSIVGIGELFSGYTLKSIGLNSVIFLKDATEYILALEVDQKSNKGSITKVHSKMPTQEDDSDEPRNVVRDDINYFAKNPKEIWRNISIVEVKNNGKIEGFKITKINPNSKFATLGLKSGDVIIKANNIKLTSYKNAIELYNKINKIDTMQIVVLRDNQEKEFVYEIN